MGGSPANEHDSLKRSNNMRWCKCVKAPSADEDMPCRCKLQPSLARHGGNLQDALRRNLRFPARRALVALAVVPDQMLQKYSGGRVLSRTQSWSAELARFL